MFQRTADFFIDIALCYIYLIVHRNERFVNLSNTPQPDITNTNYEKKNFT